MFFQVMNTGDLDMNPQHFYSINIHSMMHTLITALVNEWVHRVLNKCLFKPSDFSSIFSLTSSLLQGKMLIIWNKRRSMMRVRETNESFSLAGGSRDLHTSANYKTRAYLYIYKDFFVCVLNVKSDKSYFKCHRYALD